MKKYLQQKLPHVHETLVPFRFEKELREHLLEAHGYAGIVRLYQWAQLKTAHREAHEFYDAKEAK